MNDFFAHNYMKLFHDLILILETTSINSVHIYDIMYGLKTKLENRIRHQFYGSILNSNLRKMSKNDKIKFENSANLTYDIFKIFNRKV